MGHPAREDDLVPEALEDGLVRGQVPPYDLEGDQPVDFPVAGFVDPAHPALADHAEDLVPASEHPPGRQGLLLRAAR